VKQASAQIGNRAAFEVTVSQIRPAGLQLVNNDHGALFNKQGLVLGGVSYTLQIVP
jgi:hypothetical protein